ncbi:MAG: transposase [Lachnospiraceae bacterium]|jgi:transposase|nr:transposase [Lachnospiraceae bacterium]
MSKRYPQTGRAYRIVAGLDDFYAYFKNRITNAICEGINSMVQAAKRKARGFHTFEGILT